MKDVANTSHKPALFETLEPRLLLSSNWDITPVDGHLPAPPATNPDVGLYASMAVETDATPDKHISYYDDTNGALKYVKWDFATTTWGTPVIVDGDSATYDVGRFTSIALDSANNPHISYYDVTNGRLKYAKFSGSWMTVEGDAITDAGTEASEFVDLASGVGEFNSLVLATGNLPHISYYDAANGQLKYAAWTGAAWDVEAVEDDTVGETFIEYNDTYDQLSGYENISGVSVANTNNGTLYINATRIAADHFRFEFFKDLARSERVAFFETTSMTIDYLITEDNASGLGGSVHVDALETDDFDMRIVLDPHATEGTYNSLALDSGDNAHISYYDKGEGDLVYVTRVGSGSWVFATVDGSGPDFNPDSPEAVQGDVGEHTSIALDASGKPRIAYYVGSSSGGDLKYAEWNGGLWTLEVLDSAGDVGEFADLALDAAGKPHITYLDYTNGNVMYGAWGIAGWSTEMVDSSGWNPTSDPGAGLNAGFSTSIVIGSDGKIQVAYHNYTDANLNFAQQNYRPTLTTVNTLTGAKENREFTITYAMLAAAANDADPEADPISFRIESIVTPGSLEWSATGNGNKNGETVVPGTENDLLSTGDTLIWTPPDDTNGILDAFSVKAWDGDSGDDYYDKLAASQPIDGSLSEDPAVTVTVDVDNPTLTTVSTLTGAFENEDFTIAYATLLAAANEAVPTGADIHFRIEAVSAGALTKGGAPVVPGTTLFSTGDSLVWSPPADTTGAVDAFTIKVWDGFALSEDPAVTVKVNVGSNELRRPTLTFVAPLTGALEDTPFTITYTALAAAADEADAQADPISFKVIAITAGTLTKGGIPVTEGTTELATGEELVWTPLADATGETAAFTVVATDGQNDSIAPVAVNVDLVSNDSPWLTTMDVILGATENQDFTITYAMLTAAGDEIDPEGEPLSFRIEAVDAGVLRKDGVPVTAGVTLISTGEEVVWAPPASTTGLQPSFQVIVTDGDDFSAPPVAVPVYVNAPPTLTAVNTLHGATKNTAFTITYATLAAAADEADSDPGDAISFIIQTVSSGTLTKGGVAVVPGTTTLSAAESLVWTPPTGLEGTIQAFTVLAHDGTVPSSTEVAVSINVSTALGIAIDESKLPASVVAGSKKTGVLKKVNAIITNNSGAFISQLVTLQLYASSDGTMNDAVEIATVTKMMKLKPGKSKKMVFKKVAVPAMTPDSYRLIVDGALTNPVASAASISWGTPTIDMEGVLKRTQYKIEPRHRAKYAGTVTNLGTADVNTTVRVELYGSTDGTLDTGADTLMAAYDGILKVAAGKKVKVPLSFQRLDYGLGDNFTLFMVIDADAAVAETNELNNEAMSSVVMIPADE